MIITCRGYTGLIARMIFHYPTDEHDWNDQNQTYEIKLCYDILIAIVENGGGVAGDIVELNEVNPSEIHVCEIVEAK